MLIDTNFIMDITVIKNNLSKIFSLIGSLLFLTGAVMYIANYSVFGNYIYLACSIFFLLYSIVDLFKF